MPMLREKWKITPRTYWVSSLAIKSFNVMMYQGVPRKYSNHFKSTGVFSEYFYEVMLKTAMQFHKKKVLTMNF